MNFQTGIAISQEHPIDYVAAAVTWMTHTSPPFCVRGMTFPYAKEHLLATPVVSSADKVACINAVCHRTIEQLLIQKRIVPGYPPGIILLVKPALARGHFLLPCQKTKSHWLLNAADAVLTAWIRGER